jgi:hypothetical protein
MDRSSSPRLTTDDCRVRWRAVIQLILLGGNAAG